MNERYLPESELTGQQPEKTGSKGVISKLGKKARALTGAFALTSMLSGQAEAGQNPIKAEQADVKQEKALRLKASEIFGEQKISDTLRAALVKVDNAATDNAPKEDQARKNLRKSLKTFRAASTDMSISLEDFNKLSRSINDARTDLTLAEDVLSFAQSEAKLAFLDFIQTVDEDRKSSYEDLWDAYQRQVEKLNKELNLGLDSSAINREKSAIALERMKNELKRKESDRIPAPPKVPRGE